MSDLITQVARLIDQRHPHLRQDGPWTTPEIVRLVLRTALEIHDRPAELMLVHDITDTIEGP